jgi:hypothetical protein
MEMMVDAERIGSGYRQALMEMMVDAERIVKKRDQWRPRWFDAEKDTERH